MPIPAGIRWDLLGTGGDSGRWDIGPRDSVDLQLNAFALYVARRLELSGTPLPEQWHTLRAGWSETLGRGLLASC